jgi:hypothetical protein
MAKIARIGLILFSLCSTLFASIAVQKNSLLHHARRLYSQSGEEGIIDEMLERIGVEQGVFIEFGAADGLLFSNTRFLADRGWSGAYIERDVKLFQKLRNNCAHYPRVVCLEENIDPKGRRIDEIAERYFPDREIDVLSIDIDGLDYLVLENLRCKPKIICIESSGYWHPLFDEKVPEAVAGVNLGQPMSVVFEIARKQGYEPVCFLLVNLFFVRKDLYPLFSSIDNSRMALWWDSWNTIGALQPADQRYIYQTRADSDLIQAYDPYRTPSLTD